MLSKKEPYPRLNPDYQRERPANFQQRLRIEMLRYGFAWVQGTASVFFLIIAYYSYMDDSHLTHGGQMLLGGSLLVTSSLLILFSRRVDGKSCFYVASLLLAASFIHTSFVVLQSYHEIQDAKKILLIGYLVILVSWSSSRAILAIGLIPIILIYCYLTSIEPDIRPVDILISFSKFPILALLFSTTIRRSWLFSEEYFIRNLETITQLKIDTNYDDLTEVKNRKGFNVDLVKAIEFCRRSKTTLSIAIIDIDYFKQYNDSLGHPTGDICLHQFATILRNQCKRTTDTVARIGGEEFALILPTTNLQQATALVDRIQVELTRQNIPHPNSPISTCLTASIGITELEDSDDLGSLYERADRAMYQAKSDGRNRSVECSRDCQLCSRACEVQ